MARRSSSRQSQQQHRHHRQPSPQYDDDDDDDLLEGFPRSGRNMASPLATAPPSPQFGTAVLPTAQATKRRVHPHDAQQQQQQQQDDGDANDHRGRGTSQQQRQQQAQQQAPRRHAAAIPSATSGGPQVAGAGGGEGAGAAAWPWQWSSFAKQRESAAGLGAAGGGTAAGGGADQQQQPPAAAKASWLAGFDSEWKLPLQQTAAGGGQQGPARRETMPAQQTGGGGGGRRDLASARQQQRAASMQQPATAQPPPNKPRVYTQPMKASPPLVLPHHRAAAAAAAAAEQSALNGSGGNLSIRSHGTLNTTRTGATCQTFGTTKTPCHVPQPDRNGYNRKWTDVAFKKYRLGIVYYKQKDFDKAASCFQHVLRIRKSLRHTDDHPDVLNAQKMLRRIAHVRAKMEPDPSESNDSLMRGRSSANPRDRRRSRSRSRARSRSRSLGRASIKSMKSLKSIAAANRTKSKRNLMEGMGGGGAGGSGRPVSTTNGAAANAGAGAGDGADEDELGPESRPGRRGAPQPQDSDDNDETSGYEDYDDLDDHQNETASYEGDYGDDLDDDDLDDEDDGSYSACSNLSDLSNSVKSATLSSRSRQSRQSAGSGTAELQDRLQRAMIDGHGHGGSEDDPLAGEAGEGKDKDKKDQRSKYMWDKEALHGKDGETPPAGEGAAAANEPQSIGIGAEIRKFLEKQKLLTTAASTTTDVDVDPAQEEAAAAQQRGAGTGQVEASTRSSSDGPAAGVAASRAVPPGSQMSSAQAPPPSAQADPRVERQNSFEFLKFMNAVKGVNGRASASGEAAQSEKEAIMAQAAAEDASGETEEEQRAVVRRDARKELSRNARLKEAGPVSESFDDGDNDASYSSGSDDEDEEDDDYDEDDEEFDAFTATSERLVPALVANPSSAASVVSAMCESTASDWQDEQSLVANMLKEDTDEGKGRVAAPAKSRGKTRRNKKKDGAQKLSVESRRDSLKSFEEWQKFVSAARDIYANNAEDKAAAKPGPTPTIAAEPDVSRSISGMSKLSSLELDRQESIVSSMIDTTASEWHKDQDIDPPEDISTGNYAFASGNYVEAQKRFISALHKSVRLYGTDHEEVSLIQERLGDTCSKLGEVKEAHGHYQLARQNLQDKLGKHHRSVTRIMVSLGGLYFDTGNYSRALKYHSGILDLRRENLKDDHPDVQESVEKNIEVHEALVSHSIQKNDNEMALFHSREVLWLSQISTRDREADKLMTLEILDEARASQSHDICEKESKSRVYVKEAKKLLKKSGTAGSTARSSAKEIASFLDTIATILIKEKKIESALKCYEEKLDFLRKHQLDDAKTMSGTLRKLGSLSNKCGQYEKGIEYHERALQLPGKDAGDKLDSDRIIRGLGSSYLANGNHTAALKHFKNFLGVCALHEKSTVLLTMGLLYSKIYQIAEALNCYTKALQIEAVSSGKEDADTLASIAHLQGIFLSPKKRPKEKSCYEKALDSQDMRLILVNLGYVQLKNRTHRKDDEAKGDSIKSARHFAREILGYLNAEGSRETLDITCVLRSMGNLLSRRRRYKEAVEYYEKFLKAQSKVQPANHQERFEALTDLGTAYLKCKQKEKAFKSFQQALDELEACSQNMDGHKQDSVADSIEGLAAKIGRLDKEEYIRANHLLALLICKMGVYDESISTLEDVHVKRVEVMGASNPEAAKLCIDLSSAHLLKGDLRQARAIFDDGMAKLQKEKIPFFHPYMSQLRRLYSWHYSSKSARKK